MSGLIWVQTICHSDGILARIFENVSFEEKKEKKHTSRYKKYVQNYLVGKELTIYMHML